MGVEAQPWVSVSATAFWSDLVQAKTWTRVFQCNISHLIQILMGQSRNYAELALNNLYCKLKIVICFVNLKSGCISQLGLGYSVISSEQVL